MIKKIICVKADSLEEARKKAQKEYGSRYPPVCANLRTGIYRVAFV